ncbi:TetR/AcrR family transcriptional regulator [Streptomyces shenzhenensis]|uniref:TetR/AcrR family transcriptional regulator n=1 Tax=Streptomyces shenzhenensis TaxID=943815 RepID=UPI0015F0D1E7|nr:TetR/AcrR family transcriptional regulator [Streptomyces shenzhenensis]
MLSADESAARRGRPRRADVDRTVIETVLRLLTEGSSFAELSIEGIAREAGIGKTTVYRRWPSKDALLLDVLQSVEGPLPEPTGRSLREDLVGAIEATRLRGLAKYESALMRNMLTQVHSSPELWQHYQHTFVLPRRQVLGRILERGITAGEIRSDLGEDLELLIDMVVGPVLYRATLRPDALLVDRLAEKVVDTFLDGVRPRPRSGSTAESA